MDDIKVGYYLSQFNKVISQDICDYANNIALKHSRYIFTTREGKQQFGYCTHCHKSFPTSGLKHNEKTECPFCKSICKVKSSGMHHKNLIDRAYFTFFEKSETDQKAIVAKGLYIIRDYGLDYHNVETQYSLETLYIFEPGKPIMLKHNYWGQTWEIRKSVYSIMNQGFLAKWNIQELCSYESIKKAVAGTPFQYSTYETYMVGNDKADMVKFFALYAKYPVVEYLTKLGFEDLVRSKLVDDNTYSAINWHGKTLFKVLRLTKDDLKEIKAKKIDVTFFFLKLLQISKKDGSNFSMEEIKQIESGRYGWYFKELQTILKYTTLRKALGYIDKQYNNQKSLNPNSKYEVFYNKINALITWRDYISDCIKLEMDLTSDNVIFPKNLYKAHQNTIKQVKIQANKLFSKKIKSRARLLEKYYFEYNSLLIRAAESSEELINEGKTLHHCVGTYAERYADGKTNIFFIRKLSKPDKPFYTLELRKDEIIQVHGLNNQAPNKEVSEFIKAFEEEKLGKKVEVRISIPA